MATGLITFALGTAVLVVTFMLPTLLAAVAVCVLSCACVPQSYLRNGSRERVIVLSVGLVYLAALLGIHARTSNVPAWIAIVTAYFIALWWAARIAGEFRRDLSTRIEGATMDDLPGIIAETARYRFGVAMFLLPLVGVLVYFWPSALQFLPGIGLLVKLFLWTVQSWLRYPIYGLAAWKLGKWVLVIFVGIVAVIVGGGYSLSSLFRNKKTEQQEAAPPTELPLVR
jgi:hypothetical protein